MLYHNANIGNQKIEFFDLYQKMKYSQNLFLLLIQNHITNTTIYSIVYLALYLLKQTYFPNEPHQSKKCLIL